MLRRRPCAASDGARGERVVGAAHGASETDRSRQGMNRLGRVPRERSAIPRDTPAHAVYRLCNQGPKHSPLDSDLWECRNEGVVGACASVLGYGSRCSDDGGSYAAGPRDLDNANASYVCPDVMGLLTNKQLARLEALFPPTCMSRLQQHGASTSAWLAPTADRTYRASRSRDKSAATGYALQFGRAQRWWRVPNRRDGK